MAAAIPAADPNRSTDEPMLAEVSMDVPQIDEDATGVWQIITLTRQRLLLPLPADGRASIVSLGDPRALLSGRARPADLESAELVTWGRYSVLTGIGAGISVGQSMVLVLEPLSPQGVAAVVITAPVERIEVLR